MVMQAKNTLGLGGASMGNLFHAISDEQAHMLLQTAWEKGIRYYDTAPFYGRGRSEGRMGGFLSKKNRDDYQLSTKVGRLMVPVADGEDLVTDSHYVDVLQNNIVYDYSYDGIMQSIEDSLERLGTGRIDIAYVHDIGVVTHGDDNAKHMQDLTDGGGFKALQSLKQQGVIHGFGLGVNEKEVCLDSLQYTDLDVILLAGRYTLLEQDSLDDLLVECQNRNVEIVIGGVFNSGLLVAPNPSNDPSKMMYNYMQAPEAMIAHMQKLKAVCEQHSIPLPAAAMQFVTYHQTVKSVLIGVGKAERLIQCLDWADYEIPNAFWQDLKEQGLVHVNAPLPETL